MGVPIERVRPIVEADNFGWGFAWHQSARGQVTDLHAEPTQQQTGGAGDPGVLDVTYNEHAFSGQFVVGDFTQGESVEQSLSGVGVPAVASIDDGGAGVLSDERGQARLFVADDIGVTCRRWNWRQCVRTRLDENTTSILFILDGLGPNSAVVAESAAAQLSSELQTCWSCVQIASRTITA